MIKEQIEKIFAEKPGGRHPSRYEVAQIKKAILLLAERIDAQDQEAAISYNVAKQILINIGKLDEKLEKAGL